MPIIQYKYNSRTTNLGSLIMCIWSENRIKSLNMQKHMDSLRCETKEQILAYFSKKMCVIIKGKEDHYYLILK